MSDLPQVSTDHLQIKAGNSVWLHGDPQTGVRIRYDPAWSASKHYGTFVNGTSCTAHRTLAEAARRLGLAP